LHGILEIAAPAHTYTSAGTYTITLVVHDGALSSNTASANIVITNANSAPIAIIEGPYTGTTDIAFAIRGDGSSDPEGDTLTYNWNLGDGTVFSTGDAVITHPYGASGTFTISLTVNDGELTSSVVTTTATITDPIIPDPEPSPEPEPEPLPKINQPPIAHAGVDQNGLVDADLIFKGSGSRDADGTIVSYARNFGDGGAASGEAIPHAFSTAGTYTISLTVTDNDGATAVDTATATISEPDSNTDPIPDPTVDEVNITMAKYNVLRRTLRLRATSSDAPHAILTVEGYGAMKFVQKKGYYELLKNKVRLRDVPETFTITSSFGGSATIDTFMKRGRKWLRWQQLLNAGQKKQAIRFRRALNI